MKNILLFLSVLFCSLVDGQEQEPGRLRMRLYYSPDICHRVLSDSWLADLRNDREIIKFGYSLGTGIMFRLSPYITFESGIQYTSRGFQTKKYSILVSEPDPIFPDFSKIIDTYEYFGIPIKFLLIKNIKKYSFRSTIGIINNILIAGEVQSISYFEDRTETDISDDISNYNTYVITSIISLGMGFQASQKVEIYLEPTLQYDISSITDTPLKTYLWNGGLNLSLTYKIK